MSCNIILNRYRIRDLNELTKSNLQPKINSWHRILDKCTHPTDIAMAQKRTRSIVPSTSKLELADMERSVPVSTLSPTFPRLHYYLIYTRTLAI